jgi:hypothetical protein
MDADDSSIDDAGSIVWDPTSKRTILMRSPSPLCFNDNNMDNEISPTNMNSLKNDKNKELIEKSTKKSNSSVHGIKLKPATLRPVKQQQPPSSSSSSTSNLYSIANLKPVKTPSKTDSLKNKKKEIEEVVVVDDVKDQDDDGHLRLSSSDVASAVTSSMVLTPNTKLSMVEHESDFRKASIAVHSLHLEDSHNTPSPTTVTSSSAPIESTANRLAKVKKSSEESLLNKRQNSIGDEHSEEQETY